MFRVSSSAATNLLLTDGRACVCDQDGSNHYLDSDNVLWYGGAKNYLGHNKHSLRNLYLYVDAQPYEGQGPGKHSEACANSDGAASGAAASGYGEVWASNRCHVTTPSASVYKYGNCNPEELNATVDYTFNNKFFTTDGKIAVKCSGERWTLEQYQALGYDKESTEDVAPTLAALLGWAQEMLQVEMPHLQPEPDMADSARSDGAAPGAPPPAAIPADWTARQSSGNLVYSALSPGPDGLIQYAEFME